MTPDGALWVNIHAISHTERGHTERGRHLVDRWLLWYNLTTEDGTIVEQCREFYYETHAIFKEAGWDVQWPYGNRVELDPAIPVVIEAVGDKYTIVRVGKAPAVSQQMLQGMADVPHEVEY